MPIRMVEDPNEKRNDNTPKKHRTTSGGSGMAGALIPLLFTLFRKNPKSMLFIIIAGIAFFYFSGNKGCNMGSSDMLSALFTGLEFN
ncbi:MAG: hypothetical protein ACK4IY_06210, partial [Chitinophagales bacterium]